MVAVSLNPENSGVSGITLRTSVLTVVALNGVTWVTARRAPERTAFWTTCETKKTIPQSTAAPTRVIKNGIIRVTSTSVWPLVLFLPRVFLLLNIVLIMHLLVIQ